MMTGVPRVGQMPATRDEHTIAISVRRVIARRVKALSIASLLDILRAHDPAHLDLDKFPAVPVPGRTVEEMVRRRSPGR